MYSYLILQVFLFLLKLTLACLSKLTCHLKVELKVLFSGVQFQTKRHLYKESFKVFIHVSVFSIFLTNPNLLESWGTLGPGTPV